MRDVRAERGATTVMFAIVFTALLAAVGLGIDSSSLAFHRSRTQHAADAAALAIATDCVRNLPCNSSAATSSAAYYNVGAGANATGGTAQAYGIAPTGLTKASGQVTVTITKTVGTKFFSFLGIDSRNVRAVATAKWSRNPKAGDVVPFGVSLCQYVNAGVNNPTTLDTTMNDAMRDTIVPKNNTKLTEAYANMAPFLAPSCTVPADVRALAPSLPLTVTMLKGGLWMSSHGASINNGKLIPTTILDQLESVVDLPVNQQTKFAPPIAGGTTLLFAIYAPTGNYDHGGLRADGNNAAWKGTVDMRVIGYAPFEISGYCFSSCGGPVGIRGKFISTVKKFADFTYDDSGTDFGATEIKLTQ